MLVCCGWGRYLAISEENLDKEPDRIFSGEYSREMWETINSARTKKDLRRALYFVCCRVQELEARLSKCEPDLSKVAAHQVINPARDR